MALSPERESLPVEERAEEFPEIPITVENKGVVVPTPGQFTAQVKDDKGRPLIQTPDREKITIEIPGTKEEMTAFSKGSPDEAITWFWAALVRKFKQATRFAWRVIWRGQRAT
jgi:hypothetical protein